MLEKLAFATLVAVCCLFGFWVLDKEGVTSFAEGAVDTTRTVVAAVAGQRDQHSGALYADPAPLPPAPAYRQVPPVQGSPTSAEAADLFALPQAVAAPAASVVPDQVVISAYINGQQRSMVCRPVQ